MYGYALNNPLKFVDPSGLCSVQYDDDGNPLNGGAATDDPGEPCVAPGDTSATVTDTAPPADYQNSDIDSEDFLGLTFYSDVFGSSGGGGGGGSPSHACVAALGAAGTNKTALTRYTSTYQSTIANAASSHGISPNLLAAIGIRETGLRNIAQYGGGLGRGVFQIDLGAHPGVTPAQAFNPNFAANFAAGLLSGSINSLQSQGYSASLSVAGGIRTYNVGTRYLHSKLSGGIPALDRGTTGGNYVSNVLAIADNCF